MSRYTMNDVIQVQKETAYGADPGTWLATHAVLVSNVQCNPLVAQNVPRSLQIGRASCRERGRL